jgi:hypothetical protein
VAAVVWVVASMLFSWYTAAPMESRLLASR